MGIEIHIGNSTVAARFAVRGAELVSLEWRGAQRLWQRDPAWWDACAPLLFPVIGRSKGGAVSIAGTSYPMPPHGFFRERDCTLVAHDAQSAIFEQKDDAQTRQYYPFAFTLRVEVRVEATGLAMSAVIRNDSDETMPYCFGYHPGFVWPTEPPLRSRYVCLFEQAETAAIRRAAIATGLLKPQSFATPVVGRRLAPDDSMFAGGALHFETVASRRVWFGPEGAEGIEVRFPDSPQLGIWTKPGAPFLCIEPWQGLAEAETSDGRLELRPGVRTLAPGETAQYRLFIDFTVAFW
jgi:galactose mutarotase-like enzyme